MKKPVVTLRKHSLQNTLFHVTRLAAQYNQDLDLFKDCSFKEFFNFVSKKIAYREDPKNMEFVSRPFFTIKMGYGDCDDKTVLCLAFFIMQNISCGFSIVASPGKTQVHHIFPFFIHNDKKIDYDATYPSGKIGEKREWAIRRDKIIYVRK